MSERIEELEKKLNKLETDTNNLLDSHKYLFNTLFIDFELKPKGVLLNTQILCQELLNFVDNICKKYDINYWLEYGTLLGAKRHGGFVPWDDDVDIAMMRADHDKFTSVIHDEIKSNNLEDEITALRYLVNDQRSILFTQIKFSPNYVKGLYAGLDIFTYDYIKEFDENTEDLYYKEVSRYRQKLHDGIDPKIALEELYEVLNLSYDVQDHIIPSVDGGRTRGGLGKWHIYPLKRFFH